MKKDIEREFFAFLDQAHGRTVKMTERHMDFEYLGRAESDRPNRGNRIDKALHFAEQLQSGIRRLLFDIVDGQELPSKVEDEGIAIINRRLFEMHETLAEYQKTKDFKAHFWINWIRRVSNE